VGSGRSGRFLRCQHRMNIHRTYSNYSVCLFFFWQSRPPIFSTPKSLRCDAKETNPVERLFRSHVTCWWKKRKQQNTHRMGKKENDVPLFDYFHPNNTVETYWYGYMKLSTTNKGGCSNGFLGLRFLQWPVVIRNIYMYIYIWFLFSFWCSCP